MTDFETNPLGTAKRLAELEAIVAAMKAAQEPGDDASTLVFSVDTTQAPISIGAELAGSLLPLVHDVASKMTHEDRFHLMHGFCAALFGAMSSVIGLDNADSIVDALRTYSANIRAEEASRSRH